MKKSFTLNLLKFVLILILLHVDKVIAQAPMPFDIENTSEYSDDELYVAIVGKDFNGAHVWVDMKTGTQLPMNALYNTIQGPVYGGNKGPGENGMYADCFTKLSEIPNNRVMLAPIQGCRMFISVKEQLYLYFFGSTGAQVGYASPSHTNLTDPNKGINYELIELTYNNIGFWGNTSRVDSYNYAMALELTNTNNEVINTGELLRHEEIIEAFLASVPTEFQSCYDEDTDQIFQPTKTAAWADGTIAGLPAGPHKDYMQPYIDEVWQKYTNEDLIFDHPQIGTWKGRVVNDVFSFTCIGGSALGFIGEVGQISGKPNTQEALEGKGVLDRPVSNTRFDLMMQAQICAALTRHVIDTDAPSGTVQFWGDPSKYYQKSPCNHYAKFWHQEGIRVDQLAYGFAYDDVYEQSSTMHSPNPKSLKVLFGGYSYLNNQEPYNGVRHNIPGTIEAEHYDEGGQDIAFNDLSTTNLANSTLRNDAVDVEENGNTINIGYIEKDEWLEYSVTVLVDGYYNINFRVAAEGNGGALELLVDDQVLLNATNTGSSGGWSTWKDLIVNNVSFSKGDHIIRIKATAGDFNLDKVIFTDALLTNLDVLEEDIELEIYPNPASEYIQVKSFRNTNAVLYNTLGVPVINAITNTLIDVSALSSGVYVVKVTDKDRSVSKKIVIK